MMRRTYVLGVALLCSLAACGESESSDVERLGRAFCADLVAGLTPAQIIMGGEPGMFDGPQDAAAHAYLWVDDYCPGQLRTNDDLRSFLDANSIPYDG